MYSVCVFCIVASLAIVGLSGCAPRGSPQVVVVTQVVTQIVKEEAPQSGAVIVATEAPIPIADNTEQSSLEEAESAATVEAAIDKLLEEAKPTQTEGKETSPAVTSPPVRSTVRTGSNASDTQAERATALLSTVVAQATQLPPATATALIATAIFYIKPKSTPNIPTLKTPLVAIKPNEVLVAKATLVIKPTATTQTQIVVVPKDAIAVKPKVAEVLKAIVPTATPAPTLASVVVKITPKIAIIATATPEPPKISARVAETVNGNEMIFRVIAFDSAVGKNDGDGVDRVDLVILDASGKQAHKQTERSKPYCAFGDNNGRCNRRAINRGRYTLRATVFAKNGATANVSAQVEVR
jgi:hypothetical protein